MVACSRRRSSTVMRVALNTIRSSRTKTAVEGGHVDLADLVSLGDVVQVDPRSRLAHSRIHHAGADSPPTASCMVPR